MYKGNPHGSPELGLRFATLVCLRGRNFVMSFAFGCRILQWPESREIFHSRTAVNLALFPCHCRNELQTISTIEMLVIIFAVSTYIMDDSAKRGGYPTSELFTVVLCDPNFAVF